jgi:hypothetical protein
MPRCASNRFLRSGMTATLGDVPRRSSSAQRAAWRQTGRIFFTNRGEIFHLLWQGVPVALRHQHGTFSYLTTTEGSLVGPALGLRSPRPPSKLMPH